MQNLPLNEASDPSLQVEFLSMLNSARYVPLNSTGSSTFEAFRRERLDNFYQVLGGLPLQTTHEVIVSAVEERRFDSMAAYLTLATVDGVAMQKQAVRYWAEQAPDVIAMCDRYSVAMDWLIVTNRKRNGLPSPERSGRRVNWYNTLAPIGAIRHVLEKADPTNRTHVDKTIRLAKDMIKLERARLQGTEYTSGISGILDELYELAFVTNNPIAWEVLLDQAGEDGIITATRAIKMVDGSNEVAEVIALKALGEQKKRERLNSGILLEAELKMIYGLLGQLMPNTLEVITSRTTADIRKEDLKNAQNLAMLAEPIKTAVQTDENVAGTIKDRVRTTKLSDPLASSLAFELILYGLSKGYYGKDSGSVEMVGSSDFQERLATARRLISKINEVLIGTQNGAKVLLGDYILEMSNKGKTPDQIADMIFRKRRPNSR